MYSYKLNNSYTIYVNYTYINDCIKASKSRSSKKKTSNRLCTNEDRKRVAPLPDNTNLVHKLWGQGKVEYTSNGVVGVSFDNRVVRFVYPDAINQGYLLVV